MFDVLAHADWSISSRKRWVTTAFRFGGGWRVQAPGAVFDCGDFVSTTVAPSPSSERRLTGFDFPIGVPAFYGRRSGFQEFRELLAGIGTGAWNEFFDVARTPAEISMKRPFYPFRGNDGAKHIHLLEALNVGSIDELRRRCDHATSMRNAACAIFWTLGAQQVGKAALAGWRDIVRPALARGARLWPFDGCLADLSKEGCSVVCETYPAEAYGHVGIRFAGESKQRQTDRASKAATIVTWANAHNVIFTSEAFGALTNGFGSSKDGEDPFDSFMGLLGMIEVVDVRRNEGPILDDDVKRWEGWILGQAQES